MDGMLGWHHPKGWLHDGCLLEQLPVKSRLHGVRRCENAYCRTVWNRDVKAARDILRQKLLSRALFRPHLSNTNTATIDKDYSISGNYIKQFCDYKDEQLANGNQVVFLTIDRFLCLEFR
jgi:hypothetical protein